MSDSLAPEHVEPLLRGTFGKPYRYAESCGSTQELLTSADDEGTLAVCEEQTAGRGRLGRRWEAPRGKAILCSLLLRPPGERRAAELTLAGGIATALTVERATGLSTQIKWPNDVMLNRRKVAGVLAQAATPASHGSPSRREDGVVILGVGLNVNQSRDELPDDARIAPTSLLAVDAVPRQRAPLLADLVTELERTYGIWTAGGLEALYEEVGSRDFLRQRKIFLDGEAGIAVGIDRAGRLEVEVGGERRFVESGEVMYER